MGATDDYARRSDIERLDRAVAELRGYRETDNRDHAAQHEALEAHIDGNRDKHEDEHKAEKQAEAQALELRQQKKDRIWGKVAALAAAGAGVVSAWVTLLVYLHSH